MPRFEGKPVRLEGSLFYRADLTTELTAAPIREMGGGGIVPPRPPRGAEERGILREEWLDYRLP